MTGPADRPAAPGPQDRPRRRDDLDTARLDGEAVVFDERTGQVHHLNPAAAAVWLCCDGQTTVAEMVADLAEVFAADPAEVAAGVAEALRGLAAAGLLTAVYAPPQ